MKNSIVEHANQSNIYQYLPEKPLSWNVVVRDSYRNQSTKLFKLITSLVIAHDDSDH